MLYEIETGQRINGEDFGYQVHYYDDVFRYLGSRDPVYGFTSIDEAYEAGNKSMWEERRHNPSLRQA